MNLRKKVLGLMAGIALSANLACAEPQMHSLEYASPTQKLELKSDIKKGNGKDLTYLQNKVVDVFAQVYDNMPEIKFSRQDANSNSYQTDLTAKRISDKHQTGSTKDRTFGMFPSVDVVSSENNKFKTVGNSYIKISNDILTPKNNGESLFTGGNGIYTK